MAGNNPQIDFSIITPTYRRPLQLDKYLAAYEDIDYPIERIEIIVVDDASENPPLEVVARYANKLPVRLLQVPHGGPARARNAGAREATGATLLFVDDDCLIAPGILRAFSRQLSPTSSRALGGRIINVLTGDLFATATQDLVSYLYEFHESNPARDSYFTTSNLAVPTIAFRAIGGFDETFEISCEDRDLCERLTANGVSLVFVEDAIVHHMHHLSLGRFAKQHFTYGLGVVNLERARALRGELKVGNKRLSFFAGLIWYPFRQRRGWRAPLISSLLLLSQVSYVLGYLSGKRRLT